MSSPLDIDAIAARAEAAPAGRWETGPDCVQVPWCTPYDPDDFARTDADTDDPLFSGRWLGVRENWWHAGSPDPGPELWEFLAAARGDVLELVAEIRRLRAAQRDAARRTARPGRYRRPARRNAPGRPVHVGERVTAGGHRAAFGAAPGRLAAVTADARSGRQDSSRAQGAPPAADTVYDHGRPWTGSDKPDREAGAETRRTA